MKMNWLIKFDIWINIELVSFGANLINQILSSIHEKIDIWTGPKLFLYHYWNLVQGKTSSWTSYM